MCGIAGVFAPGPQGAVAAAMAARLVHRGPDDHGLFAADGVALACRRLAIVDVAGGHQPLHGEADDVVLVCNGEIYNHRALRAELQARGHRFASGSDVEVILHLYQEAGDLCVERLEGQFAFALYDARRRRLLLARDRMGVSPLHWTRLPGGIAFSSEIKGLLAHPAVSPRLDVTGVDQVFAFPGLVSPRTAVVGVESLPPGHLLVADAAGVHTRAWWDLDYPAADAPAEQAPPGAWAEALGAALRNAVARRLQGEAPIGAYPSGGLDSSLIVALLAELGAPTACFSIGFPGGAVDERAHQARVIAATGLPHHLIEHPAAAIPAAFERMIRHAECPVRESYNTAALALADAAHAAGARVVLSGEGADELFAGYPGYRVDAARAARGSLLDGDARAIVFGDRAVHYEGDLDAARARRLPLYHPDLQTEFFDHDCLEHPLVDAARLRGRDPLHQRSYLDCKLRLADHLLGDHGDRMTMAASVEARFPFLDEAVVDLARRMPPAVKLRLEGERRISKAVVRDVDRGRLPDAIIDRDKMGFHAPGTPALIRQAPEFMGDLLSPARIARQGVFDPATVAAHYARHAAPGFRLDLPFDDDPLMVVLSTSVLMDALGLAGPG
ncbi:MAG: asparagine synthase (glutamine-hydrolyzing) [bacterium]